MSADPTTKPAPPVLLSMSEGIAHITLNRPEAANGMTIELLVALHEAVMTCHADRSVRAVLLRGNGPHFCAGGDVRTFAAKGEDLPAYIRPATSHLQNVVGAMSRLAPPVVASVQGFAAGGGGLGLVCAVDFVVAARSSKFLSGGTRVGMAPDAGVTVTLQRIVGFRRAMDILLTNPTLTAEQALEIGLVSRVVPDAELDDAALGLARQLADGAPLALAATKRLLWNGLGSSFEACLPEEARTVSELSGSADAREGLAAVIEKRQPRFLGR